MFHTLALHWRYAWLVAASLIAGVMNAMAGGGSFLSFPAMLGMGVLPIQANATNTVALWPGQLTSVAALRTDLRRDLLPVVTISSIVLGGVGGACMLLHTRQVTFMHLVPWLLLVASVLFGVSGPVSRWLRRRSRCGPEHRRQRTPAWCRCSLCCFRLLLYRLLRGGRRVSDYDGTGAVWRGGDAPLNALKVLAACLSNFCAVLTFLVSGRLCGTTA